MNGSGRILTLQDNLRDSEGRLQQAEADLAEAVDSASRASSISEEKLAAALQRVEAVQVWRSPITERENRRATRRNMSLS